MATFEHIDVSQGLELVPYQYELEHDSVMVAVRGVEAIKLGAAEAALFLERASGPGWRPVWECDMQSISEDSQGRALISSWMDLTGFRRRFCDLVAEPAATVALMSAIKERVKPWRNQGVEVVELLCVRDPEKHIAAMVAETATRADINRFFSGMGEEQTQQ